jgi:hypothetical protein
MTTSGLRLICSSELYGVSQVCISLCSFQGNFQERLRQKLSEKLLSDSKLLTYTYILNEINDSAKCEREGR